MKKILMVFGTRPEAIKMAPLIKEFKKYPREFEIIVCTTAQHRKLLDQILGVFEINPDYDLNIMEEKQDLYHITIKVLLRMKEVLKHFRPDMILIQGDTTTTLAAALAAFYEKVAVGHIEAGLRTNNIYSPYPEEINRQLTTKIAKYHFAPTKMDKQNLLAEGTKENNIVVTGNTVIDALFMVLNRIRRDKSLEDKLIKTVQRFGYPLSKSDSQRRFILVTGHRRENFGQGLFNICEALKEIAGKHSSVDIIYPVHPNPNVREPANKILTNIKNIYLIEPLDYETFVYFMSKSYLILTDSGGVQEEAPSLAKPVLLMRDATERPAGIAAGAARIVGTSKAKIVDTAKLLLTDKNEYQKMCNQVNPYGDGKASERIVEFIRKRI